MSNNYLNTWFAVNQKFSSFIEKEDNKNTNTLLTYYCLMFLPNIYRMNNPKVYLKTILKQKSL